MRNRLASKACATMCGLAVLLGIAAALPAGEPEVTLSSDEFKRLEVFEGHALTRGEKAFAKENYRAASAEYDSFILEFPKSPAIPYALLRKGRSLQLDNKRHEAIKVYREVLDYFPNVVKYAAAALYYTGVCHRDNGDIADALKSWAKLADDEDYSKHRLAAGAINELADNLARQGKQAQAVEYYKQVAKDFRNSNGTAANYAISRVIGYYIRTKPDEPALRAFYTAVGGFGGGPGKIEGETVDNTGYWNTVQNYVRHYSRFSDDQAELEDRYLRYWTGKMDDRFPEWDDYQIELARLKLRYEKDQAKYYERLDQQYEKYQKPKNHSRTVKWLRLYSGDKEKATEYYNKLDFAEMDNGLTIHLMKVLWDEVRDAAMARNVFPKIRLDKMSDGEKLNLARYFWGRDEKIVRDLCMSTDDREKGLAHLMSYYHNAKKYKEGIEIAKKLVTVPDYARSAWASMAQMQEALGEYEAAIASYRQADYPPGSLYQIAECYVKLKKIDQAVAQLREVENFFKDHAPTAAWKIAEVYRGAGDKKREVATLRGIMKKYPKSGQSSQAHVRLERMGVKIGGGVDAE